MPGHRHLAVIAYDVPSNKVRARLSRLLEGWLTRVQESVFEGWITRAQATSLMDQAGAIVGIDGSVRLYLIPRGGIKACEAHGFPPRPDHEGHLII
jgi:CRISPR-associated protein Cas2